MSGRLSVVIAFVGVLGLIGFVPASEASHDLQKKGGEAWEGTHEEMPEPPDLGEPIAECWIIGAVDIGNKSATGRIGYAGISNKSHNHYRSILFDISCMSFLPDYIGNFHVEAAGGTDGPDVDATGVRTANHGEDGAVGWSHSSCYDDDDTTKAPAGCDPPANIPRDDDGFDDGPKPEPGDWNCWHGDRDGDDRCDIADVYDGTNTMGGSNACNNCGEIEVAADQTATASCIPGSWFEFTHECDARAQDNVVMFCRGVFEQNGNICPATSGVNLIAWGVWNITSSNRPPGETVCFWADLHVDTHVAVHTNGDGGLTDKKFDQVVLEGPGILWFADANDKAVCFGDPTGKKQ